MKPEIKFVKRMTALFGAPEAENPADVINEYVNVLAGQNEATLDRAADALARSHKFRNWPTVAECLDAVGQAKKLANGASMGLTNIEDFDGWWAERLARVRIAKSERELEFQIGMVEPYAYAGWILRSRLPEIVAAADARRKQWQADDAATIERRKTGEAA